MASDEGSCRGALYLEGFDVFYDIFYNIRCALINNLCHALTLRGLGAEAPI